MTLNDVYYLTHFNPDPVPEATLTDELALMQLTSNGLADLIKAFAQQPFEHVDDGYIHEMPSPGEQLPREKPLPQPKPPTKWEKFAAQKGIKKHKHDRMEFDEAKQRSVPRSWRKRNDDPIRDAKKGQDDFAGAQDPFTREAAERKEKVDQQKGNQLKNVQFNERQARKAAGAAAKRKERGAGRRPSDRKGGKK